MYKVFQSSKKGACDCSVRAFMVAENWDWYQAYDFLCESGRKIKMMPNAMPSITNALKELNYQRIGIKPEKGKKKPTVKEFAAEHRKGTYFLRLAHHVVTVKDGDYYDSWDCGNKSVYLYFKK